MPTRIRLRDKEGNVYTYLGKKLPKRGKVKVRTSHGFVVDLAVGGLTPIPEDEHGSKLSFGNDAI